MRLVFTGASDEFAEAARHLFPHAEFRVSSSALLRGPTAYIAHAPDHLDAYEACFKGLGVRVRGRLRATPLGPGHAMYLPVTYDSWAVVTEGPDGLAAAMEAALDLHGLAAVVCPACQTADLPLLLVNRGTRGFTRRGDRVWPTATT